MHLLRSMRLLALASLLSLLPVLATACGDDDPEAAPSTPPIDRVLIVHSYDEGFRWTAEQGKGIVDGLRVAGLAEGDDYELRVFHMDTRLTYTSSEQVAERADEALRIIDDFDPDVVFVTDDVALRTVAVPYLEERPDTQLPFVFSGVNTDPTVYPPIKSLEAPGGVITGLLERIPVAEALTAAKRVFPTATRIVLMADGSTSSAAAIEDFNKTYPGGLHEPLDVLRFEQAKTFADWQRMVLAAGADADLIGVLNYHGLTDDSGAVVPPSDVLEWTLDNSEVPVIGLVTDWARDGLPMAVGNAGFANGVAAAGIAVDIARGTPPGQIPIVNPKLTETAFNLPAIERLGLEVSEAELAEAALVVR